MRRVADQCYLPLIKLIKGKKLKVTLNIPLSLLEQMDRYGYSEWLEEVKGLVESEKLKIVGSGAYHPILTKIPTYFVENQIILNEYALGYYFGKQGGFEGDPSIMIQNLKGFFPPELAVNDELLGTVNELGYEWMLVDETSIPKEVGKSRYGVYEVGDFTTRVVARNNKLSVSLASKRDLDVKDFISEVESSDSCVLSMDGEVFGHHNERGLLLLEYLIDAMKENQIKCIFVSDYVRIKDEKHIQNLVESTWNTSQEDLSSGNLYPMWDVKNNKLHKLQWEVLHKILKVYKPPDSNAALVGFEEIAVWKPSELEKIDDKSVQDAVNLELQVNKALHSCQFWWATYRPIGTPSLILHGADLFENIVNSIDSKELGKYVAPRLEEIRKLTKDLQK